MACLGPRPTPCLTADAAITLAIEARRQRLERDRFETIGILAEVAVQVAQPLPHAAGPQVARAGRAHLLTQLVRQRIYIAAQRETTFRAIAKAAGVHESTLSAWRKERLLEAELAPLTNRKK